MFLTLTAPGFGPVHTRHVNRGTGTPRPCRPRRNPETCPHGMVLACDQVHDEHDTQLGRPLCPQCYDYPGHAVWNAYAGELWRRTTITANRQLRLLAKHLGTRLRLSYAKVAEYQRRGLVHFHALIRLDGHDPDDPDAILAPDPGVTTAHLEDLLRQAITATSFRTPPHPANPDGWPIGWGEQLDPRHVCLVPTDIDDTGQLTTTTTVAAYLAKYATKATETTGHLAARITTDTITIYADLASHTGRLVAASAGPSARNPAPWSPARRGKPGPTATAGSAAARRPPGLAPRPATYSCGPGCTRRRPPGGRARSAVARAPSRAR